MNAISKIRLLHKLRDEVYSDIPDPWVFPEKGAVKGFMGPGPLMIVAERPSTGPISGYPGLLYSLLERYDAGSAHLTDLIKSRAKVRDPYPADIGPHRRIFDRELTIIQPRVIIALGSKVYDLLQFFLADRDITIRRVRHYAHARWGAANKRAFTKQLRGALKGLR